MWRRRGTIHLNHFRGGIRARGGCCAAVADLSVKRNGKLSRGSSVDLTPVLFFHLSPTIYTAAAERKYCFNNMCVCVCIHTNNIYIIIRRVLILAPDLCSARIPTVCSQLCCNGSRTINYSPFLIHRKSIYIALVTIPRNVSFSIHL